MKIVISFLIGYFLGALLTFIFMFTLLKIDRSIRGEDNE